MLQFVFNMSEHGTVSTVRYIKARSVVQVSFIGLRLELKPMVCPSIQYSTYSPNIYIYAYTSTDYINLYEVDIEVCGVY